MPKRVFLSYTRDDLDAVRSLEHALTDTGIEVWRDQESLYGGTQWPKAIGDAIASSDTLLLAWSSRSARSHFVEFEWTTAMALKKTIVPCLLDDTPLPPSLSAVHGVSCKDLDAALVAVIRAVNARVDQANPARESEVINKLKGVDTSEPEEAVRRMRAVFSQEGWIVSGTAYTSGGNIIINQKSWAELVVLLSALAAVVLVVIIALNFKNDPRQNNNVNMGDTGNKLEHQKTDVRSSFTGLVIDAAGNPVDRAKLEITELPGQTSVPIIGKTTSDGDFHIDNIPAAIGARGVVAVTAPGYTQHSESIVLPGPKTITLKRAR